MRIEKLGGLAVIIAMAYPTIALLTGVLDGLFGFIPDHPFLDDGWIWFLKPAFWMFLLIGTYRHARDREKVEALLEFYQATKVTQSDR